MKKTKAGFLWLLWAIVTIVAVLHLLRALFGLTLLVDMYSISVWVSYLAFVVLGYLSYRLFKFLRK
jgi:hypothetical protein